MLDQLRLLVVPPREIWTPLFVTGVTVASTKSYTFGKRKSCPGTHRKKKKDYFGGIIFFFTNILFGTLSKCHGFLASKQVYSKVSFGNLKAVNSARVHIIAFLGRCALGLLLLH